MNNYKRITTKLTEAATRRMLSRGHVFMVALIDEQKQEISLTVSYGNDKKAKSWVGNYYANSMEHLCRSVIMEGLEPYYAYKENKEPANLFCCDIDIHHDWQDIRTLEEGVQDIVKASRTKADPHKHNLKVELYVSVDEGDFQNFGGPLELNFVTELMIEKGFHKPLLNKGGMTNGC